MWEFPNGRVDRDLAGELGKVIQSGYSLRLVLSRLDGLRMKRDVKALVTAGHTYTHFKVTVHAFRCEILSMRKRGNLKWVLLKSWVIFRWEKLTGRLQSWSAGACTFNAKRYTMVAMGWFCGV